jgi:hypothetical protein
VGVVDTDNQITRIYKDVVLKHCDNYNGYDGQLYRGRSENLAVQTQTTTDPHTGQQVPVVISPQQGDSPHRIGTRDLTGLLQGGLQGVRIWNRPLSTSEIAGLYAGQVPGDSLVAEYPLNADTGTVAVDTTGAHTGTITGASWVTESFLHHDVMRKFGPVCGSFSFPNSCLETCACAIPASRRN